MKRATKIVSSLLILSYLAGLSSALAQVDVEKKPSVVKPNGGSPVPKKPLPTPAEPSAVDPVAAKNQGIVDGSPDGKKEGNERGLADGQKEGAANGYNKGYQVCGDQEKKRQHDLGYSNGYINGDKLGVIDGINRAQLDGSINGNNDGRQDGIYRADRDANIAATPLGHAQGIKDAQNSDAASEGYSAGLIAGDAEARKTAQQIDYPRGRNDVRNEKYAEPISVEDAFSQKASPLSSSLGMSSNSRFKMAMSSLAVVTGVTPDYRYKNFRGNYKDAAEIEAYRKGYLQGYDSNFQTAYKSGYDAKYDVAYQNKYPVGCSDGKKQSFVADYNQGFTSGKNNGYRDGFDRAYKLNYGPAYNTYFVAASKNAYSQSYNGFYNTHFENARSEAYREKYNEIYNSNFSTAKNLKYKQVYPTYAQQEYDRGRNDETQDFADRPLRLIFADATETDVNGLMEPGEALRVRLKVRNFAGYQLSAQDVKVTIEEVSSNGSVVSIPQEVAVQDLMALSATTISEALEFRMTESALEKDSKFRVRVYHQARLAGETTIDLVAKYKLAVRFAEQPVLKEGLETPVRISILNQSQKMVDAGTTISMKSDPSVLEVTKGTALIGMLGSGEEKIVEMTAISRVSGYSGSFPIVINATSATGKRIGLMDGVQQLPIDNDYVISLREAKLGDLKQAGNTDIDLEIVNANSRISRSSVQVVLRVLGPNASNFKVKGKNPVYIDPIDPGKRAKFDFKLISKAANSGGVIELEATESGKTVVIHRIAF